MISDGDSGLADRAGAEEKKRTERIPVCGRVGVKVGILERRPATEIDEIMAVQAVLRTMRRRCARHVSGRRSPIPPAIGARR